MDFQVISEHFNIYSRVLMIRNLSFQRNKLCILSPLTKQAYSYSAEDRPFIFVGLILIPKILPYGIMSLVSEVSAARNYAGLLCFEEAAYLDMQ